MKRWIYTISLAMIFMLGLFEECMGKTGNGQQPPFFTRKTGKESVHYTELREAEEIQITVEQNENGQYYVLIPERMESEKNINAWLTEFYEKDAKEYEDFMGIGIVESEWYLTEKERKEMGFSYSTSLYAERTDDAVISFQGFTYTYSGGVHGNTYSFGVNFDSRNGSVIELSDIFFDTEEFFQAAQNYIEQNYREYIWEFEDLIEDIREYGLNNCWCMDGYGINFLYDGANWQWQYRIPYEILAEYMKPEYFPASRRRVCD